MSRLWYGIALLCVAAACHAQFQGTPLPPGQPISQQKTEVDDPGAVEIPLKPGTPVSSVLTALNEKGFRIRWKPEQVLPSMTLLEKPRSTRIDNLLNEILEPWGMRAYTDLMRGGYLVKPAKKKKTKDVAVEQNSPS